MKTIIFVLVFTLFFDPYPIRVGFEISDQFELLGIASDSLYQIELLEGRTYSLSSVAINEAGRSPRSLPLFAFWIGAVAFPDSIMVNSYLDSNLNGRHDLEDLAFFADTLGKDLSLFAFFSEYYGLPSSRVYIGDPGR